MKLLEASLCGPMTDGTQTVKQRKAPLEAMVALFVGLLLTAWADIAAAETAAPESEECPLLQTAVRKDSRLLSTFHLGISLLLIVV